MRRVVAALFIGVLAVAALHGDGEAHPGHTIYCDGWAADDKLGVDNYQWTADLSCDNGPGDVLSMGVWRERAQFGTTVIDWHADPIIPVRASIEFGVANLTLNQLIYVPPYFNINCRRVKALMAVSHGNTLVFFTQSGGECF